MRSCRSCDTPLTHRFCDLGMTPLANEFLPADADAAAQVFHPLQAYVCTQCKLVQVPQVETPERIFGDYAYFSSYSSSWLEHARCFAHDMTQRLRLDANSLVIEVASNDGYLLRHFRELNIPVLGIEPARNVAAVAAEFAIPTVVQFLDQELAQTLEAQGNRADLLIANNVLAHVPNLNGFVAALATLLKPEGTLTLEFPHLLRLIEGNQFDTIYHEHFFYFCLHTVRDILARHGLRVFDVDRLDTHGGSLRVHAQSVAGRHTLTARVQAVIEQERAAGLDRLEVYDAFQTRIDKAKLALLEFLIQARRHDQCVVGYGAAAKGNTLLNYCGVRSDLVQYVVDRSPHKQGRLLPGTRIPVCAVERLRDTKPAYVLLLAWNLKQEIMQQINFIRDWGGRFVTALPRLEVLG